MTDDVLHHRIGVLERAHESIARSLESLVRLEQHHADTRDGLARAWTAIETDRKRMDAIEDSIPEKLEERLYQIELAMPGLKETSRWVKTGVIATVAAAAALVWSVATRDAHATPAPPAEQVQAPAQR